MIEYNIAAEYAALVVIVAVLLSFSRDYDSKTMAYRFLKTTYLVSFFTILTTIVALLSTRVDTPFFHVGVATVANALYFMLIPSISLCYVIYVNIITRVKFSQHDYVGKIAPFAIPHILYLLILFVGFATGKVFSITETVGYVRGPWYQLPYYIVVINMILVVIVVCRNMKSLHRDILRVTVVTAFLACGLLLFQYCYPDTIMTGVLNTTCILVIHLYTQNVKKATDQLTGAFNRMAMVQLLEEYVKKQEACSIYVFSFRGMKTINERYGVECGDKLLMRAALIFKNRVSDRGVFRYGGDEFALILDQRTPNHGNVVAMIVAELSDLQSIDGNEIMMDFVYARADHPQFGRNVRELISAIDYSLSSLKTYTRGARYVYDPDVVKTLIRRSNMVEQIKSALERNTFEVHYQPIYNGEKGAFTQAEALVRMRNRDGYLLYPGDFINLAVKTGLIVQMTYLVLDKVCADLRYMMDTRGAEFQLESVSVNFPYLQFTDIHMQKRVIETLAKHNIPHSMIKIEITERELVENIETTKAIMQSMGAQGFAFELDDFGMDYSNVSVVLGLPLEIIKMDRSLLLAALEKESNRNFFRHLAQGILDIGAKVICEGVEEQNQLDFVLSCGCQYVQGYYFSKPLERDALLDFLQQRDGTPLGKHPTMARVEMRTAGMAYILNSKTISRFILNEIEDVVYISDPKTYELYYVNGQLLRDLGNPSEGQWYRQKCYRVLQGRDAPCPFCTNHLLKHDAFYSWEHFNEMLGQHYFIQDKLVSFEGIEARLEIAKNVTKQKVLEQNLTKRLEEQQALNESIALLHTQDSPDDSINKLLGLVAEYHDAERGYIFLLTEVDGEVLIDNTHEWCAAGVSSQAEFLQKVPYEIVAHWFEKYRTDGEFCIDSLSQELDPESEEYRILQAQDIVSLTTAPLYNTDGTFMGFLGVDNPKQKVQETSVIRAVSSFVADFLDKNKQLTALYQVSYFDSLTSLHNRHSYSDKIQEMKERPPSSLGVIYVDINGLKVVNDLRGHKEGDAYIRQMGDFLLECYGNHAYRIGGDEFVVLCDGHKYAPFKQKLGRLIRFINKDAYPCAAVGYCWREKDVDVVAQIEQADRLMYQNKEAQYVEFGGKIDLFRRKYLSETEKILPEQKGE